MKGRNDHRSDDDLYPIGICTGVTAEYGIKIFQSAKIFADRGILNRALMAIRLLFLIPRALLLFPIDITSACEVDIAVCALQFQHNSLSHDHKTKTGSSQMLTARISLLRQHAPMDGEVPR